MSFSGCTSKTNFSKETHIQENLNPNQILEVLKTGNEHFVHHKNAFPHLDDARMKKKFLGNILSQRL